MRSFFKTSCIRYEAAQNCHRSAALSGHLALEKAHEKELWKVPWMAREKALWTELLTAPCPLTPLTSPSMLCRPPPLGARPPISALD
jgi:hypothetical protein